jgi:hypothetical protein
MFSASEGIWFPIAEDGQVHVFKSNRDSRRRMRNLLNNVHERQTGQQAFRQHHLSGHHLPGTLQHIAANRQICCYSN